MGRYAENTGVSVEKSVGEIERTLQRYGATKFFRGWGEDESVLGFQMNGKMVQFKLPMPRRDERRFTHTPSRGTQRTDAQAYEAWEQACRQAWRALSLVVKAKLEAVEAGISTFEQEFLASIMVGNNETVGDRLIPQIEEFYLGDGTKPTLALSVGDGTP